MKLNWNFLGGRGVHNKKPSIRGSINVFWNCKIRGRMFLILCPSTNFFKFYFATQKNLQHETYKIYLDSTSVAPSGQRQGAQALFLNDS